MKKLSIIIPVYFNEGELLPLYADLKENVLEKLKDDYDYDYEIVMVDDGSKDNSYSEMLSLAKIDSKIKLVKLSRNFGEHPALLAGLNHCTGTCAVRKAADMQEPSSLILDLLDAYEKGNKVVIPNRKERHESSIQKFFSSSYYFIIEKLTPLKMPEGGFDGFMIDRDVIDIIVKMNELNAPITEQILWTGFEPEYVGYSRQKRTIGKSRWTFSKKMKLVIDCITTFSSFPLRFISHVGFISFLLSLLSIVLVFILKLTDIYTVDGYTSTLIILLFIFGTIMISLGVISQYLWRMFDSIRKRPPFIVDEIHQENKTENQNK